MIMAQNAFYPEDVLIEKMESGEYGWLDYVNHFSAEWQDELAEYIGVSKASVSKWETAATYPDITLLPRLAAFLISASTS